MLDLLLPSLPTPGLLAPHVPAAGPNAEEAGEEDGGGHHQLPATIVGVLTQVGTDRRRLDRRVGGPGRGRLALVGCGR
jgi:hypothetical protein